MSTFHNAYPQKNIYFTGQYTSSTGEFAGDLKWHVKNVIIGSMRNWSRNALEWNLASDPYHAIHTPGDVTAVKVALPLSPDIQEMSVTILIAHASKFVFPGSVRIASNNAGSLYNVAFKRPDGKKVLIEENDASTSQTFNINLNGRRVTASLEAGAVGTFVC